MRKYLLAAAAAAALAAGASAAHADDVYNTSLGPMQPPGVTTTDATGTRSTNASDVRVDAAGFGFFTWLQQDVGGGAVVGITTDYARSGNGSAFFSGVDSDSKASLEYYFEGSVALSDFDGASFDWYRDGVSTNPGAQAPALRLLVFEGSTFGSLIFEPYYQNPSVPNVATNSWQTSTIDFGSTVWARPWQNFHGAGASCDTDACFDSLGDFLTASPSLQVYGVSIGIGGGWDGQFRGAMDNVSFTFGGATQSSNFEVLPSAVVPEPATWAMMLLGFGGLGAVLRRRRQQAAFA